MSGGAWSDLVQSHAGEQEPLAGRIWGSGGTPRGVVLAVGQPAVKNRKGKTAGREEGGRQSRDGGRSSLGRVRNQLQLRAGSSCLA